MTILCAVIVLLTPCRLLAEHGYGPSAVVGLTQAEAEAAEIDIKYEGFITRQVSTATHAGRGEGRPKSMLNPASVQTKRAGCWQHGSACSSKSATPARLSITHAALWCAAMLLNTGKAAGAVSRQGPQEAASRP